MTDAALLLTDSAPSSMPGPRRLGLWEARCVLVSPLLFARPRVRVPASWAQCEG